MRKRWITIDCILPVLEMMDDCRHGIDLWEQAHTGLAWLIVGPPTQRMHNRRNRAHVLHFIQVFQLFFCSCNFEYVPKLKHCYLSLKNCLDRWLLKNFWTDKRSNNEEQPYKGSSDRRCSLFLSEASESSSCNSYKSFTFSNNQGTCEIL